MNGLLNTSFADMLAMIDAYSLCCLETAWADLSHISIFSNFKSTKRRYDLLSSFAIIQICVYLYSSNFTPHVRQARKLSQAFLLEINFT